MFKKQIQIILFVLLGSLLAACGDEHDVLQNLTPATGARVKFIHASPDAPEVDLYINDVKVSGVFNVPPATPASLSYPSLFPVSEYVIVEPGTASINAVVPETRAPVVSLSLPLENNKYYSVFAIDSAKKISSLVLEDYVDNSLLDGRSYIRFVHLMPNGQSVDLAYSPGVVFAAASAQTLVNNIRFKGVTEYVPVEPGTYSFQLRNAGSTTSVAPLINQIFEANRTYTIYARGFVGGTSLAAPALTRYINK